MHDLSSKYGYKFINPSHGLCKEIDELLCLVFDGSSLTCLILATYQRSVLIWLCSTFLTEFTFRTDDFLIEGLLGLYLGAFCMHDIYNQYYSKKHLKSRYARPPIHICDNTSVRCDHSKTTLSAFVKPHSRSSTDPIGNF